MNSREGKRQVRVGVQSSSIPPKTFWDLITVLRPIQRFTTYDIIAPALRTIFAILFLIFATSSHAEIYRKFDNGWEINKLDGRCTAFASYENDEMLFISYLPLLNEVWLTIYHPTATSLNEGDTVELYVKFIVGKTIDRGWGTKKFEVEVADDGGRFLRGRFEARDMLRDIARSSSMALTLDEYSDRIVSVYTLKGTSGMIDVLRECSLKTVGLNPKDPFLR